MILQVETERLTFSQVELLHARDYRAMMSDAEMGRHTDIPCQPTEEQALEFINWMMNLNSTDKGRAWTLQQGDQIVGFIRLNRIDKSKSLATVGYELAKPFWGKGLVSEALRALVNHAHGQMGLHRLEAGVFDGNTASARVLEKAGFQKEGVQRSCLEHRNERRDLWLYGRLASDQSDCPHP